MESYEEKLLKGIVSSKNAFCGPKIVQLDLTGFCNNNCIGCWVHSPLIKEPPKDKNTKIPFEAAKKLIEDLAYLGTKEIFLSGAGEPFLYPQIFQILELIKEGGMSCNIITNFSLVNEDKAAKLIELKVDLITASIWAGTSEVYLKMHPGKKKEDFYRLKDFLKNLSSLKKERNSSFPRLKIYNVICNRNYQEIGEMIDFAKDVSAEMIEFQVMDIIEGQTSCLALSKKEINEIKRQFKDLEKRKDVYFKELEFINKFASSSLAVTREIAKEFPGRFLKVPSGFSIQEVNFKDKDGEDCLQRQATCLKDITPKPTDINPLYKYNENLIVFEFPLRLCKKCTFFGKSCPVDKKGKLTLKFLKIAGYGSFLRRLNSENIYDQSYDRTIIDEVPCYAGWIYSRILSTGEVIPCCKANRFPLGNLNRTPFRKIWNSKSYNIFREKAKNESKKDKYFSLIDCYRCCDNLGMNLTTREYVGMRAFHLENSSRDIIIKADNFSSGNVNANTDNFGKGMVIDGGFDFSFAVYEVDFPQSGRYTLWSYYAAEQVRPVDIIFDGGIIKKGAMNQLTGGWYEGFLSCFKEIDIEVRMGRHSLKIYSEGLIPHIKAFAFKPASKGEVPSVFNKKPALPQSQVPLKYPLAKKSRVGEYLNKITHNYLIGICNGRYAFKGPFHVQIDLTNDCNNNCIGCWCNSPLLEEKAISALKKRQFLPLGLVKNLLDELAFMGTREIYYSGGGEPFIHPQIMKILEYTKEKNFVCYVNTNFTLLDRQKIKALIELGIEHFTVSTWAATPETYVATHPNKNKADFYQLKNNLKFLNEMKASTPYVKLYNVILNLNYQEIEEMINFAKETRSESVEFTVIDTMPGKTDKLLLNERQCLELYQSCQKIKSRLDKEGCLDGIKLFLFEQFLRRISSSEDLRKATYDRGIVDKMPCYIGWLFSRIMPDGNVNSCLKAHRIPTGNLYKESFGNIWNGKKQIEFRKKTLVYEKTDPFFRLIGNDPDIQEAGCYKSCDDIGRNRFMHSKMQSIPKPVKKSLKFFSTLLPVRNSSAFLEKGQGTKSKEKMKSSDLVINGIENGRKAFTGPKQVVIDLTNRCNARCIGCWLYSPLLKEKNFSSDWLKKELKTEVVKRLIDDLSDLGVERIRFTGGGEPLLHPDILEILQYVKEKNIKCALTTNFSLVNKDTAKRLAALKLDELAVSLWAGDEKVYLRTHPGVKKEEFLQIRENLKLLSALKGRHPFITLCNVIGNFNYDQLVNMFNFALDVKADGIYFTLVDKVAGQTDSLLLSDENRAVVLSQIDVVKKMDRELDDNKKIKLDYFDGFIRRVSDGNICEAEYDNEAVNKIPCYAGWIFSRILADGRVSPCCRGVNLSLGNINEQSFKEIWRSEKYNEFRCRAKYLSKSAPYFDQIGCKKMCDNLMHNEEMHKLLRIFHGK